MLIGGPGKAGVPDCGCLGEASGRVKAAPFSRRRLLGATIAGATANVLAGAGTGLALSSVAQAQTRKSPEEALQALMDGNRRFVERNLTFYRQDIAILQRSTAQRQEPFASVLSCADSRVPVELVFDQSIGHVFVNRVAGNIVTTEIMASIEYGAEVLGTKVIMVLAHGNCGAVEATIDGKAAPGQISSLYRFIRPAVNEAGANLRAATEANAKIQAQLLKESSPLLASRMKDGKLAVVAAFFDIESGKVTLLS
jgi:carbonic anhydrase